LWKLLLNLTVAAANIDVRMIDVKDDDGDDGNGDIYCRYTYIDIHETLCMLIDNNNHVD